MHVADNAVHVDDRVRTEVVPTSIARALTTRRPHAERARVHDAERIEGLLERHEQWVGAAQRLPDESRAVSPDAVMVTERSAARQHGPRGDVPGQA